MVSLRDRRVARRIETGCAVASVWLDESKVLVAQQAWEKERRMYFRRKSPCDLTGAIRCYELESGSMLFKIRCRIPFEYR